MAGVILLRGSIRTETRLGKNIENHFDRSPLGPGKVAQCQGWKLKHPGALHARGGASSSYNCHGLTFASRRTGIENPRVVEEIVQHDDYVRVPRNEVLPGDIVIYVDDQGDISHSGIVVEVMQLAVKVLSKWGECHEVIHNMNDCPYPGTTKEFYRVSK